MKNLILSIALFACSCTFLNAFNAKETAIMKTDHPTVIMETTQGNIELTLFPDVAPKAVENFLTHIQNHYYDGLTFHRVIPHFMIQGGDPSGNGTGGKSVWGKPFADEFDSKVQFTKKGLLAMANAGPNTNGSQFFITTALTPWLNNKHTIFGEVTKGYDVIEKIEKTPTRPQDNRPLTEQKIIKMYVKK